MFFCRHAGHGLEPVCKMGSALFNCPILHGIGHHIGYRRVQAAPLGDGAVQGFVGFFWQALTHCRIAEYQAAKHFRDLFHHHYLLLQTNMVFHGENSAGLPSGISCGKTGLSSAMGTPVPVQKSKCQKKEAPWTFCPQRLCRFPDVRIIIPDKSICQPIKINLCFFIKIFFCPPVFFIFRLFIRMKFLYTIFGFFLDIPIAILYNSNVE